MSKTENALQACVWPVHTSDRRIRVSGPFATVPEGIVTRQRLQYPDPATHFELAAGQLKAVEEGPSARCNNVASSNDVLRDRAGWVSGADTARDFADVGANVGGVAKVPEDLEGNGLVAENGPS